MIVPLINTIQSSLLNTMMKLTITRLEKESFKTLDKPESFAHAQEIEKEAVLFAKEVLQHFSYNLPAREGHLLLRRKKE